MKLFNHAYPAEVIEAVMQVIANKDASRRIKNNARTVKFKGQLYEVGLNSNRDAVWIRWYVDHSERKALDTRVKAWASSIGRIEEIATRTVPQTHVSYAMVVEQAKEAKQKLEQLRRDLDQAQRLLNNPSDIIFEQRFIRDIAGHYLVVETAFPEFRQEPKKEPEVASHVPLRESENGAVDRGLPADKPGPRKPARKTTRRKRVAKQKPPKLEKSDLRRLGVDIHEREERTLEQRLDERRKAKIQEAGGVQPQPSAQDGQAASGLA